MDKLLPCTLSLTKSGKKFPANPNFSLEKNNDSHELLVGSLQSCGFVDQLSQNGYTTGMIIQILYI